MAATGKQEYAMTSMKDLSTSTAIIFCSALGRFWPDPEAPATGPQVRYPRRTCRGNDAP
jgi:hypothetical protein